MGFFKNIMGRRASSRDVDPAPPDKRPGRNEPCWCGSGRKYKKCHMATDEEYLARQRPVAEDCSPAFG